MSPDSLQLFGKLLQDEKNLPGLTDFAVFHEDFKSTQYGKSISKTLQKVRGFKGQGIKVWEGGVESAGWWKGYEEDLEKVLGRVDEGLGGSNGYYIWL